MCRYAPVVKATKEDQEGRIMGEQVFPRVDRFPTRMLFGWSKDKIIAIIEERER